LSAPTPTHRRLNPKALILQLRTCFSPQITEVEVRRIISALLHSVFNYWMEILSKDNGNQSDLREWLLDLNLKRPAPRPPVEEYQRLLRRRTAADHYCGRTVNVRGILVEFTPQSCAESLDDAEKVLSFLEWYDKQGTSKD